MSKYRRDLIDHALAEEAALWVARIQSADATKADHRDFEEWLEADPGRQSAYEEMKGLWSEMRDMQIELPAEPSRLASGKTIATTMGFICLLGLATVFFWQTGVIDRFQADYYTSIGETSVIRLEDGTEVTLNTDAAIQTRYTDHERRVVLLRGEAFFDVVKNPQRPFVVDNKALTAKALGTHYSVRAGAGLLPQEVQVEEGEVEVETPHGVARLGAGDVVTLDNTGNMVRSKQDVSSNTAWRDGKLVFSGQSLREVLKILAQYRHGRILILDDRAAKLSVSGIFDLKNTDQALHILEGNLPVVVTRLSGMMVLVRSR
ncbi:FecR family protein [Agrobacterium sp. rho-13.3]|uniref:FecR family protein n=1 Tax=Agrobacterium sp. rho-13.3 TaxID=3072980 RepID=UPI002A103563|nr:FecR family protein [Agrobacterium sp. rho-13.3]MDX8309200.1 FecR family protein [Agrobacterium sp. rho-13.3]